MAGVSVFELGNVAATLLILRATDPLDPAAAMTPPAKRPTHSLQMTCETAS